jgi:gas vesicle protein
MSRQANENREIVENQAKDTLGTVMDTVKDNKRLLAGIGIGIAAGCGIAVFLLATDSGKKLRKQIQIGAEDLHDFVSEQVEDRLEQLRTVAQNMMEEHPQRTSSDIRRVA